MTQMKSEKELLESGMLKVGQRSDGWALFMSGKKNPAGWMQCRMRRSAPRIPGKLRSVAMSWNGERFAVNDDVAALGQDIIDWATSVAMASNLTCNTMQIRGVAT